MLSTDEEVEPISAGQAPGPSTEEEGLRGCRNIDVPSEVKVHSEENVLEPLKKEHPLKNVTVTVERRDLWKTFCESGNEMIVNHLGR